MFKIGEWQAQIKSDKNGDAEYTGYLVKDNGDTYRCNRSDIDRTIELLNERDYYRSRALRAETVREEFIETAAVFTKMANFINEKPEDKERVSWLVRNGYLTPEHICNLAAACERAYLSRKDPILESYVKQAEIEG